MFSAFFYNKWIKLKDCLTKYLLLDLKSMQVIFIGIFVTGVLLFFVEIKKVLPLSFDIVGMVDRGWMLISYY